jgi:ribose-phosphate pyrophosphokinase
VVVTDTIPLAPGAPDTIEQLSIGLLLSDAIGRIHMQQSVSALFEDKKGGK